MLTFRCSLCACAMSQLERVDLYFSWREFSSDRSRAAPRDITTLRRVPPLYQASKAHADTEWRLCVTKELMLHWLVLYVPSFTFHWMGFSSLWLSYSNFGHKLVSLKLNTATNMVSVKVWTNCWWSFSPACWRFIHGVWNNTKYPK